MQVNLNRKTFWWTVIFAAAIAIQVYVFHLWLHTPPSKAKKLKPLIAEMDDYFKTHGQYPISCIGFGSFTNLSEYYSIYIGKTDTNGVSWSPFDVSSHDFTVLTATNGYEIFLPTGHIKPISFSSFPVWRLEVKRTSLAKRVDSLVSGRSVLE